ncbi:DUF498-domain-containing protein [Basidiobolus meristosporus CBS 931.73]|uniref:DUF498-domain-containing protein n=1 Tax=Basidiobolus meristosporus CBS 931.73 TaxID=1314790 RepID=A0A1Y1XZR7_9FUNG|nr:DUF498-domain-containing protein [Basidiobolus meristosporus CBS 931.73]|eukprot:ORX91155.1 DUF498-domain-containing protein [Basidiobolus meristosporus CBS 931.73]
MQCLYRPSFGILSRYSAAQKSATLGLFRKFSNTGARLYGEDHTPLVNILARKASSPAIDIIGIDTFTLSDGEKIQGPIIILNGTVFEWNVPYGKKNDAKPFDTWVPEMFKLFEVVSPKPEILVLGTGDDLVPLPESLRQYLFKQGVQIEIQNTRSACQTYNVLLDEERAVSAALLPRLRSVKLDKKL